jgi:maltose alpha-D-glucosyltransferase/alpha-amylase
METERIDDFEPWARLWYRATSLDYLRAYMAKISDDSPLAQPEDEIRIMLPAYLLDEAMQEIGRELSKRPDWLHVPLRGILSLLEILHPSAGGAEAFGLR